MPTLGKLFRKQSPFGAVQFASIARPPLLHFHRSLKERRFGMLCRNGQWSSVAKVRSPFYLHVLASKSDYSRMARAFMRSALYVT